MTFIQIIFIMSTLFNNIASIKFGAKLIIDESQVIINKGDRIGLVGPNGCGKSSLLEYILINIDPHIKIYYMKQDIELLEDQTVMDFMLRANMEIYEINRKIREIEQKLNLSEPIELTEPTKPTDPTKPTEPTKPTDLTDAELDEYNTLTESDEYKKYGVYVAKAKRILLGLGISDVDAKAASFSGGWRMRLAIAKALIIEPELLIMDEPTNHLDLNATVWLSNYLTTYKHTMIITSHQVDFIDQISNMIWTIATPDFMLPKLYTVRGSYQNLQRTLSDISKASTSKYEKYEKELKGMRKSSKVSKDQIESYIKKNQVPMPLKDRLPKIGFPDVQVIPYKSVVRFDNVSFSYDDKPIISKSDFGIRMDDRIVIVGPNGAGKTTLFKLLLGKIEPTEGTVICDHRVRIGHFNQQIIESLPLESTSIEYLKSIDTELNDLDCRTLLARVGIKKSGHVDMCMIPIGSLSGGQKARLSFCGIQTQNPHILLLDEPTNHLDIPAIECLIEGLNEFAGGVVMITHDVHLINSINDTTVYELANGRLERIKDGIDAYIERFVESENRSL